MASRIITSVTTYKVLLMHVQVRPLLFSGQLIWLWRHGQSCRDNAQSKTKKTSGGCSWQIYSQKTSHKKCQLTKVYIVNKIMSIVTKILSYIYVYRNVSENQNIVIKFFICCNAMVSPEEVMVFWMYCCTLKSLQQDSWSGQPSSCHVKGTCSLGCVLCLCQLRPDAGLVLFLAFFYPWQHSSENHPCTCQTQG